MATAQSAPPRALDDACWELSFEEPFDALSLWSGETGEGLWKTRYIWDRDVIINDELQYYIDPVETAYTPFEINDGVLSIIADRTPDALRDRVGGQAYVSGVLTTHQTWSQKHGRFEVRAKVPAGKGLWSAFWLLPTHDRWPEGVAVLPEIDVMEHLGDERRTYHTTLHTNQTGVLTSHPYDHTLRQPLADSFHLYSVVWTEDTVAWYFDGALMAQHPTPSDFTQPVHFLLNLAVGGQWPGPPDARTAFPARYEIDYVRAWTGNGRCP